MAEVLKAEKSRAYWLEPEDPRNLYATIEDANVGVGVYEQGKRGILVVHYDPLFFKQNRFAVHANLSVLLQDFRNPKVILIGKSQFEREPENRMLRYLSEEYFRDNPQFIDGSYEINGIAIQHKEFVLTPDKFRVIRHRKGTWDPNEVITGSYEEI